MTVNNTAKSLKDNMSAEQIEGVVKTILPRKKNGGQES